MNSKSSIFRRPRLPAGHRFFIDCLRESYARMIEWSVSREDNSGWFVTSTFKTYEPLRRAYRDRDIWLGRLALGLVQSGGGWLKWICATEWQIREVVHLHLLVFGRGIGLLSRKRWECRWESLDRNTGFCRIYDANKKAAPYLAKYTSKSLGGEIQWGGTWRGLIVPTSVSCSHIPHLVSRSESRLSPTRPCAAGLGPGKG